MNGFLWIAAVVAVLGPGILACCCAGWLIGVGSYLVH
jgi:hypothetical protein